MIKIRKSSDRGHFQNSWLTSSHTFSFSEYYDPSHMHFKHLRVINEDYIAANGGFGSHDHHDMEIMTYMISGELEHKDSMGNSSVIKAGEIQFMRAGKLVTHSEFNPSSTETSHLLQIWIMPNQKGLKPEYHQKFYSKADKENKLCKIATGDINDSVFQIAQNIDIYASILDKSQKLIHTLKNNESAWVQIVTGELEINNIKLTSGDGAAIEIEELLSIQSNMDNTEFLLFHFK